MQVDGCGCARDPLNCLVPSYVLREIAERGDDDQRRAALGALERSESLRSSRTQAEARTAAAGPPRTAAAFGPAQIQRVVRDAAGSEDLAAAVVRGEGDPPHADEAVNEAYDRLGTTWDFFFDVFARNSIDNAGMALDAVVHFGEAFDNAFWDGDQMVFGDGSGRIFNRMTLSLSVAAHELGHGVIQFDGPLVYRNQSGALNEHIADAFGAMVVQWSEGQTVDGADWLIGSEILAEGVDGVALRSMKEPGTAYDDDLLGKDPQPDHMDGYERTARDHGGVHLYSGICNRAFYTAAAELGGHSWEHAGRILYATLGHPQLRPATDFRRFARLEHAVAGQLYGVDSAEAQAIATGWDTVGVAL